MANKHETKNRIKSIASIRKTTNAMRLVSTTKISKMRHTFERTKEYAQTISRMLAKITRESQSEIEWLDSDSQKEVVIVITSDMGLCGGYNANILKLIREKIPTEASLIIIGRRNRFQLRDAGYQINQDVILSDSFDYSDVATMMDSLLDQYKANEIGKISLVYTEFINALNFNPRLKSLLPLEDLEDDIEFTPYTEYEPNEHVIMSRLIEQYLKSVLYNHFYESKTCEQSARRLAMEQATDNADDLIEMLQLRYNQDRQAAITQELTELVGAS